MCGHGAQLPAPPPSFSSSLAPPTATPSPPHPPPSIDPPLIWRITLVGVARFFIPFPLNYTLLCHRFTTAITEFFFTVFYFLLFIFLLVHWKCSPLQIRNLFGCCVFLFVFFLVVVLFRLVIAGFIGVCYFFILLGSLYLLPSFTGFYLVVLGFIGFY